MHPIAIIFFVLVAGTVAVILLNKLFIRFFGIRKAALPVIITLTSAISYFAFIYLFMWGITYIPNRKFDSEKWKTDLTKRHEMSKSLIEKKLLVGKTKDELIAFLGNPSSISDSLAFYNTGQGGGGLGVRFHYLNVYIRNNKVDSVGAFSVKD